MNFIKDDDINPISVIKIRVFERGENLLQNGLFKLSQSSKVVLQS